MVMASAKDEYQQRPGTVNLGDEYEHLIPALFVLRAICRADIVDAWLASNVEGMGAFDDVIFYVEYDNGQKKAYVMQLKHRGTAIKATAFEAVSDDYSIMKYRKSFEDIMQNNAVNNNSIKMLENIDDEDLSFIIYTIADLAETIDKRIMKNLNLVLCKQDMGQKEASLLNTSIYNDNYVYKFKIDDKNVGGHNEKFLSQFYLHIKQGQTSLVEQLIQQLITEKFGNSDPNIKLNFLNFIKMWGRGDLGGHYKLRKKEVELKLTELLLNSYLVMPKTFTQFKKADLWNEIVNSAEVTLVENYKEGMESRIWSAINSILYKYTDRKLKENAAWGNPVGMKLDNLPKKFKKEGLDIFTIKQVGKGRQISMKCLYIVLWKAGLLPLLVKADDVVDAKNIFTALLVSSQKSLKRHVVLLFKGEFPGNQSVMRTLADIKDMRLVQNVLDNLEISLQARKPFALSKIIDKDSDILKEITIEKVLRMLHQPLIIGKKCEDLPENYIERSVTRVLVSRDVLHIRDHAFVINGPGDIVKEVKSITNSWRVIDGKNYFKNISAKAYEESANIVALEDGKVLNLQEIQHFVRNKNLHYLRYCDGFLEWLRSAGNIDDIRKYLINVPTTSTISVKEEDILQHFSKNLNIISSNPGMGKSVMIKRLAEKCMEDYWVETILLNNHHKYFKKLETPTLSNFADISCPDDTPSSYANFANSVISMLKQEKKVLVLMDAFDEISSECTTAVISLAKAIRERGHHLWITTRPVQSSYLEKKLNTFSISLNPFTAEDQKTFLKKHFHKKKKHNIDDFVEKLQELMSKSFSNWDAGFLGVPLHLQMIAEVFEYKNVADLIGLEKISTIDLYQDFIDNKLNVYWKKMFGDNVNGFNEKIYKKMLHHLKDQHTKASLLLFFPKSSLIKLFDCVEIEEFLKDATTEDVGIITSTSDLGQPIFSHRTFAEFLAATFLAANCQKEQTKPLLVTLFDDELTVVRQLFDRMLAKGRPLHLAVLNNDLSEVNKLLQKRRGDSDLDFDLGGRTPLHLAAAWGSRHKFPLTNIKKSLITMSVLQESDYRINFVDSHVLDILENVFSIREFVTQIDNILGWSVIDYACYSYSLDALEIMISSGHSDSNLDFFDKTSLIYYCVKCGYKNILMRLTLENRYISVDSGRKNLLHVAIESNKNTTEVIEILLSKYTSQIVKCYTSRNDFDGNLPLMSAAKKGNLEIFQILLKFKVDSNKKNTCGLTALHLLVFFEHLECLKELFKENSVDLNTRATAYRKRDFAFNNPGHTALYFAILNDNLEITKLLIQNGANVHLKYENEQTVLHVAAINGFTDCIQELFNNGGEIHSVDDSGRTPLHYAVQNIKLNSINLLLQLGADINKSDVFGRTPLHYATQNFRLDQIQLPRELEFDVNRKDANGRTSLHYAAQKIKVERIKYLLRLGKDVTKWHHYGTAPAYRATKDDKLSNINFLIQYGANPNEGDDIGRTALHYATEQDIFETIECLLKLGADLNKTDEKGQTALFQATERGKLNVIQFLLQFSPDVNKDNNFKVTPLHLTAEKRFNNCALALMSSGANVNLSTIDGCTSLFIAVKKNNERLVKLLVESNANVNKPSHDTFVNGNSNCVTGKCCMDSDNSNMLTPLHVAVQLGNLKIITFLLKSKVKINQTDNNGWTALHFAASEGRADCIYGLLKRGAGLHLQTKDGSTPLHLATKRNQCQALEALLISKCGKAINLFDNEMQTALHIACYNGYLVCVKILISNGADVNLCTGEGFTPLNLAVNQGHTNVGQYLEQLSASE